MAQNQKALIEPHFRQPLVRAIELFGGARQLARATKPELTHTTIRNFLKLTQRPPRPEHVIAIERATKGKVDRLEFYPEILMGPLGKRLVGALVGYAEFDPLVEQLVADLRERGIRA